MDAAGISQLQRNSIAMEKIGHHDALRLCVVRGSGHWVKSHLSVLLGWRQ